MARSFNEKKVTLYLIRLLAAVQAAELQIDTAGSI